MEIEPFFRYHYPFAQDLFLYGMIGMIHETRTFSPRDQHP